MKHTFKKSISALLCAALVFGALCVPAFAAGYALGDVDGNGKVDTADARLALRAAIGLDTLSAEAFAAADVDHSGAIITQDARTILRVAVGLMQLSSDGKRFEDILTAGELLRLYMMNVGDYDADNKCYYYGYEFEGGAFIIFSYYVDEKLPFEVYCCDPSTDPAIDCSMRFNKTFSVYTADAMVFDADNYYAYGTYTVNDTANLNPNTGASCFIKSSYEGDPALEAELPPVMAVMLSTGFRLLLADLNKFGAIVTKEDMHLNRVTEDYLG